MKVDFAIIKGAPNNGATLQSIKVVWDSRKVVNGHMVIVGYSGTGKTTTLRHILRSLIDTYEASKTKPRPLRIHIFDVHDDIDMKDPDSCSDLMFSASSTYGLNPFIVNPDVHSGGVLRAIQQFISIIAKSRSKIGERQQAALKKIIIDLYYKHGFVSNDPKSWNLNPYVPQSQKNTTHSNSLWKDKRYPNLNDLVSFASNKLQNMLINGDDASTEALRDLNIEARLRNAETERDINYLKALMKKREQQAFDNLTTLVKDTNKLKNAVSAEGVGDTDRIATLKDKAINSYAAFIRSINTGRELERFIKYDNPKVIQSLIDRLSNLKDTGIFQDSGMPFDESKPIFRYRIKHMGGDYERRIFVMFRLLELYREALIRGEQDTICEVVVIDECKIFMDNDPDNIITKFVNELRKFGTMVICASQDFSHFSDHFLMSIGTKVILGLSDLSIAKTAKKLLISQQSLTSIEAKKSMLINISQTFTEDDKYSKALTGWVHGHTLVKP